VSRKCSIRKISQLPTIKGFKPFGWCTDEISNIKLSLEEYEVLRLLDYEKLNQEEAAPRMNISRPTLTRIYETCRKKIAEAFIEGKAIIIEGGNVEFNEEWYQCEKCHHIIKRHAESISASCPVCESDQLFSINKCYFNQCDKCRKCQKNL